MFISVTLSNNRPNALRWKVLVVSTLETNTTLGENIRASTTDCHVQWLQMNGLGTLQLLGLGSFLEVTYSPCILYSWLWTPEHSHQRAGLISARPWFCHPGDPGNSGYLLAVTSGQVSLLYFTSLIYSRKSPKRIHWNPRCRNSEMTLLPWETDKLFHCHIPS